MEENSEQNRSEQPTPFKLARARKKGAAPRGADLGYLAVIATFLGFVWFAGANALAAMSGAMRAALVSSPSVAIGRQALFSAVGAVAAPILQPVALLGGALALIVLTVEIAQVGGVLFSTEPLRLDFSRLNPAKGLKRVFSLRLLIETGKSVLKLAVYSGLAALVITGARARAVYLATDAVRLSEALAEYGRELCSVFVGAAVVFAALDQLIVRGDFLKRMRMSRREIKRESRDREGDPRLKQKRRQLHREFSKFNRSVVGVRGSDVMITNPTHYAVALKYDARTMSAPMVTAQGADRHALMLRRQAFLEGVTIIESRDLARQLYLTCELGREIPDRFYEPVADVYRRLPTSRA